VVLPSHASDGADGATWPWSDVDIESCWRQCCRVLLVISLFSRAGRVLPSQAGDGPARATWSWCDVDDE
jgi:hypothetical protein